MPASSRPGCRDPDKRLDTFDFDSDKTLNLRLVFELATGHFVAQHADGLFLGPPGTEKRHLAQAIGFTVIQQGHRVCYREAHVLLDQLADAHLAGTRKDYLRHVTTVPLLVIDDRGMKPLPHTAAEDLLEIAMRRYERAATPITSIKPVEDRGNFTATLRPSPRCLTGSSTTLMSRPAGRGAGVPGSRARRLHSQARQE